MLLKIHLEQKKLFLKLLHYNAVKQLQNIQTYKILYRVAKQLHIYH
jgi:hypothetical protein